MERGVALSRERKLTVTDLPSVLAARAAYVLREVAGRLPTLAEREADYIRHVLERNGENRTRVAKVLGIERVSLWRKLKKYGMEEAKHDRSSLTRHVFLQRHRALPP